MEFSKISEIENKKEIIENIISENKKNVLTLKEDYENLYSEKITIQSKLTHLEESNAKQIEEHKYLLDEDLINKTKKYEEKIKILENTLNNIKSDEKEILDLITNHNAVIQENKNLKNRIDTLELDMKIASEYKIIEFNEILDRFGNAITQNNPIQRIYNFKHVGMKNMENVLIGVVNENRRLYEENLELKSEIRKIKSETTNIKKNKRRNIERYGENKCFRWKNIEGILLLHMFQKKTKEENTKPQSQNILIVWNVKKTTLKNIFHSHKAHILWIY